MQQAHTCVWVALWVYCLMQIHDWGQVNFQGIGCMCLSDSYGLYAVSSLSWSWRDTSLDLTLGIDAMGRECARANQMVLWVTIHCLKSSSVGAFTWLSLRWLQSVVVQTKKEFLCCSVFEWGTKNGLELSVACLSIMFSAVKSWNFVGLICLLFAGWGFKNCSTGMVSTRPSTSL